MSHFWGVGAYKHHIPFSCAMTLEIPNHLNESSLAGFRGLQENLEDFAYIVYTYDIYTIYIYPILSRFGD